LEDTYIKVSHVPSLKNPVAIIGLPGLGDVGKLAARTLVGSEDARLFAELYSPHFPDFVLVEKGVCRLPRYEFWELSSLNPNAIVLTGDFQPSLDDPVAHNVISDKALSFLKEKGCNLVITIGGFRPSPKRAEGVRVAFTFRQIPDLLTREGASIYRGRIVGAAGLILGMSRLHGMEGLCILAPTQGLSPDEGAASLVLNFLKRVLPHLGG
jgi:hypothetical protein